MRTNITASGTPHDRVRSTATTFDAYGMPVAVEDKGDDSVPGDETCTRTTYARNDTAGINSLVSRTQVVANPCSTPTADLDLPTDSTRPGDVVSDTATSYDSKIYKAAQIPTKGEAQWMGRAKGYTTDGTPSWQQIAVTDYDTLGRPTVLKDTNNLTTATTVYTPTASGPLTKSTVTNALSQTTTTLVDLASGAPTKVTDPNGKITESEYDSLGRVTKVWLPNRLKVLSASPNYVYAYKVTNASMSWVSTGTINGDGSKYNTTYEFYDSLLRPRQTQTPSPVGGRLITLNLYDDRGLAVSQQSDIWDNTSAPSATPVQTDAGQAPIQTDTTYDGAGRAYQQVTKTRNVTRWTINSTYTGDTVTTSAPTGGQATAVVTNALGQTTERREYGGANPTGTEFTTTGYTYTPAGQQKAVTGPDQATWSYTYDLFGRQISSTDPDKGTSTTTYDSLDRIADTTDAENKKLLYGYDDLGRKTAEWQKDKADSNQLAAWTFDTPAKGQPATSVRYDGGLTGKAYTQKVTSYDNLYHVTGSQLTLPDSDPLVAAGVPKTLVSSAFYNLDGTVDQATQPGVGGLPTETVEYSYNATGQQLTSVGTTGYVLGAAFSPQGDLAQLTLGTDRTSSAKKAFLNYEYEPGTRRLTRSYVTDDVHGYMPQELKFAQDDAGNVTSIFDATTQGGTAKADYQCFTYDGHRRLTEAWTPKAPDCATNGRTTSNIDGQAPYWTSYTYGTSGQRKTETQHATAGDTTTTYTHGTTGQPHPLTTTTTGSKTNNYAYDKTGNTTQRPGPTATQNLTWNTEGQLATTTEGTKQTTNLYDADGQLLIRRDNGDGDTTLYLDGEEVRLTVKGTSKTLTGTRYYTANGQTIGVRTATTGITGTKLVFLAGDHHGTSSLALEAGTYALTKRYTTPFGAPRGTSPTAWPDDKAFLGKPADTTTGLTHISAREYDPGIGQFISVDPLLTLDQHQSLNGYAYANNTPVTSADPTGMWIDDGTGHSEPRSDGGPAGPASPTPGISGGGPVGGSNGTADGNSDNGDDGGCGFFDLKCGANQLLGGGKKLFDTFNEGFYGIVRNGADSVSYVAWAWDSDCWNGGAGAQGCDYGSEYDNWLAGQGINTSSDTYQLSGFVFSVAIAHKGAVKGRSVGGCSFDSETPVLLEDGKTKRIDEISVGDKVEAADPKNGEHEGPRTVTATFVNHDDDLVDLTLRLENGKTAKLQTTSRHPFWDDTTRTWKPAGELVPGHTLNTPTQGHVRVVDARDRSGAADMYNLTVDELHTYYVLAGTTPVLVHNTCGPGISTRTEKAGDIGKYTEGEKTRDPASQWYHEELSNEELLDGINNPGEGDGLLVSRDGTILGGHHRWDELQTRVRDGRIDPGTPIRIDVYDPE